MKIKNLQIEIKELVTKINNKHKHPYPELISYMKLIEEVGEITEIMLSNQISTRKKEKQTKKNIKELLGDEIADTMISLISLANDFDIDMEKYISKKLSIHFKRV